MKERAKQATANRLATSKGLEATFRLELEQLKPPERFEVVTEMGGRSYAGHKSDSEGSGFIEALPLFLAEECIKGLKPKLLVDRLSALLRAARNVGLETAEAATLSSMIEKSAAEGRAPQVDPSIVVEAARASRPSLGALTRVLRSRQLGFDELILWARLTGLSAGADFAAAEAASLSQAIGEIYASRGPGTNVVPVELRTLQRALAGSRAPGDSAPVGSTPPPGPTSQPPETGGDPLPTPPARPAPPDKEPVVPPSLKRDLVSVLEEAVALARSERPSNGDKSKRLERENAELTERLDSIERTLENERTARRAAETGAAALNRDLESERSDHARLRKDAAAAAEALADSKQRAAELQAKTAQLEDLVQASSGSALKIVQKSLRDETLPLLDELGEYVRLTVAREDVELMRLDRSYGRLRKVLRQLMLLEGEAGDRPAGRPEERA